LDPTSLNVSIGLISVFSVPAWSWFTGRLGRIVWTVRMDKDKEEGNVRIENALANMVPAVILVDEGLQLRPNNPVWRERAVQVVVTVDVWKGKPPKEWWVCNTLTLNHKELGGITNGTFQVHIAKNILAQLSMRATVQRAVIQPKFKDVLDATVRGIRCPIPSLEKAPLGQDNQGLLQWEKRSHNVEAPTVFSSKFWVRRRLSPKELCAVLDVPRDILKEERGKDLLRDMAIPGKVRAQIIEIVREALRPTSRKRLLDMPRGCESVDSKRTKLDDHQVHALTVVGPDKPKTLERERYDTVTIKSTKADDAGVPVHLWDDRCLQLAVFANISTNRASVALNTLREKFMLKIWKRRVARDFRTWMLERSRLKWWVDRGERQTTFLVGVKAINYAMTATWWEWDGGSSTFFWRWDPEFVREVRDGIPPRFVHEPPSCKDRQRPNSNPLFANAAKFLRSSNEDISGLHTCRNYTR
jgi:hypothetical protein